jgi:hypothetical protein
VTDRRLELALLEGIEAGAEQRFRERGNDVAAPGRELESLPGIGERVAPVRLRDVGARHVQVRRPLLRIATHDFQELRDRFVVPARGEELDALLDQLVDGHFHERRAAAEREDGDEQDRKSTRGHRPPPNQ